MNSRDVYFETLHGKSEQIPFSPFVLHLAAIITEIDYMTEYCRIAEKQAYAQFKCAEFFGIDNLMVGSDAFREASAWGVEISWEGTTPDGKTFLDIDKFEEIETPNLLESPRTAMTLNVIKEMQRLNKGEKVIFGWIEAPFAEICSIFGIINIMKLLRKEKGKKIIDQMLSRIVPIQLEYAKLQIEAGVDLIGSGDAAISQIGPKHYMNYTQPATKELFRQIKQHVPVLYHVCGDNSAVDRKGNDMLQLIADTGCDILDIDFQIDMGRAKSKIGKTTALRGNVNTQILGSPHYTVTDVQREITEIIEKGKEGGKYFFAAGCEWPWDPLPLAIRNMGIAKGINTIMGKKS